MRFVSINDLHLSTKAPSSRIDNYEDELFDLLQQVKQIAVTVGARAVLIAGDIFHSKTSVSVPLIVRLVRWCFEVKRAGIDVLAIPGNHDLVNNRYETLPRQPLGLVFAVGAMENVSCREGQAHGVTYANAATAHTGEDLHVLGIPFPDAFDWLRWMALPKPQGGRSLVLAHCFASMDGGTNFGEPVLSYKDLALLPYDIFVFGHDHTDDGVQWVGDKAFVNIGAISRGALTKDEITRDVKCVIYDLQMGQRAQITEFCLTARPAREIFDLDLKAKRDQEAAQVEAFVLQLENDLAALQRDTPMTERLDNLQLQAEVRNRVLRYITDAEAALKA